MSVIITSFRESDKILKSFPDIEPWSVSRWQPKGYFYNTLEFLGAYDKYGHRLQLRGREDNPLDGYKEDWKGWLKVNVKPLNRWLKSLDNHEDIMLCCWCPHSKATREQMKKFGTFACHTGLIGRLININRPDIQLWLDFDHAQYLVPPWKPKNFRTIDI
jgi:hypothetical protein